jgi:hypothetical protein
VYSSTTLLQLVPTKTKNLWLVIDEVDHLDERILYKTLAWEIIERMRHAGAIAAEVLRLAGEMVRPGVTTDEIEDDVRRLLDQWNQIEALAKRSKAPTLLYREPDMAVRVIREEFSQDYRSILIDDRELYSAVREYVASISPELADRVAVGLPPARRLAVRRGAAPDLRHLRVGLVGHRGPSRGSRLVAR